MRVNPFPEADILTWFANQEIAKINIARDAPATKDEAWIRAAKFLVGVPLPKARLAPGPAGAQANASPSAPSRITFPPRTSMPPPAPPR